MAGSRGPMPKPAALKLLEGNPGKRALNLGDGVNPRIEIPAPPRHILAYWEMRSGRNVRERKLRHDAILAYWEMRSGRNRACRVWKIR